MPLQTYLPRKTSSALLPGRPAFSTLATQSEAIFLTPGVFFHFSRSASENSTIVTPLPCRYFWET